MTLKSVILYLRKRAEMPNREPDVRAWFADAATLIERLEQSHVD